MKNNAVTVILVMLVLGLGGFLVYDKVVDKDVEKESKEEVKIEEKEEVKEYTYENLAGNYYFETDAKISEMPGAMARFWLVIDEKGTFNFRYNTGNAPLQLLGNYYIENDQLIFNYRFKIGSDSAIYYKVGTFTLAVDSEVNLTTIVGNEANGYDLEKIKGTEIILKKNSTPSELDNLPSFDETFKNYAGDDNIINY